METEEAVADVAGLEDGFALFQERREPRAGTDKCILRGEHVVDEPEDRVVALRLAQIVARCCMVHLLDCQLPHVDPGLEEVEVVGAAGLDHRHGRQDEVDHAADVGGLRAECLERISEYLV